jgi:hypothetical protein
MSKPNNPKLRAAMEKLGVSDGAPVVNAAAPAPAAPEPVAQEAAPAAAATPAADPALDKSYEAVMARDAELRRAEEELKARQQQIQAQMDEFQKSQQLLQQMQADPVAFVEQHLPQDTFDRYAQRKLAEMNQPQQAQQPQSGAEMAEIKRKIDEYESKLNAMQTEAAAKEQQQALNEYVGQARAAYAAPLDGGEDKFALLRAWPNVDQELVQLTSAHLQQTGQVLSPADAVAKLNEIVTNRYAELSKAVAPKSATPQPAAEVPQPQQTTPVVTNDMAGPAETASEQRPLTHEEVKRRAIEQARGKSLG